MDLLIRFDQLDEREKYRSVNMGDKYHLGQLKLLMSEIWFLSNYTKFTKARSNTVVYVGAAEGFHISYLAQMFPELQFELWDPRPYKLVLKKNINCNTGFFTDTIAKQYSGVLFISDIRTQEISKVMENMEEYNKIIVADMMAQYSWIKIIKPAASFLKFKAPYGPGKFTYFKGELYLQPYSPKSTELRLLVTNNSKVCDYDQEEIDEKLAFFNGNLRALVPEKTAEKWRHAMSQLNLKMNWDNLYGLEIVQSYLTSKNRPDNVNNTVHMFAQIIRFLTSQYRHKYDIIYEDIKKHKSKK